MISDLPLTWRLRSSSSVDMLLSKSGLSALYIHFCGPGWPMDVTAVWTDRPRCQYITDLP